MATSEACTDSSFHCLECGNQVKLVHGDKKLSFDLHRLSHKSSSNTRKQESDQSSPPPLGESISSPCTQLPYTCPICNKPVEILYNDIKLSLKIHSKKHSDHLETPSEDQMSSASSRKTSKNEDKKSKLRNNQKEVDSTIIDDAFITLPSSLRAHRGFILKNVDGIISCSICKVNVEILNISEHIKTKSHEDNVIELLRNFISDDLQSSLDCLGFSGSNLVCNLCDCKIDLCSSNPHETIVNVFIHNAQNFHVSKRNSLNEDLKCYKSDDALQILQSLSEMSPEINENRSYLDVNVETSFICRLCTKSFAYDDEFALLNNLVSHFVGQVHVDHHNAILTLEQFETSNQHSERNHMFIVSKGSIYCKRCFSNISSDTNKIEEHISSCPATNYNKNDQFLKQVEEFLKLVPSLMRTSDKKTPNAEAVKSLNNQNVQTKDEGSNEANCVIEIERLLNIMPLQFRDVGYIVEDDDGKAIKCLLCDCRIPPSHYNLKTHLMGRNHKLNEDKIKTENVALDKAAPSLNVQNTKTSSVVDKVYQNLVNNDPLVKANDIILMDFGDGTHYFCSACGDLIPTSTDTDQFKANIYQHVTLASHLHLFPNQKKIIGTKEFPKGSNVKTVDELFGALPKDLRTDRKFIKPLETNGLYCSLCKVKVPMHANNLQEHLEGGYHCDLLEKLEEPQDFVSKAVGFAVGAIQDAIFHKIKMSDRLIKENENYLVRNGEHYFCSMCSATIKNCSDLEDLRERFLNHLEGNNHIQNVVTKLMESNPNIRKEKCYAKVKNQTILCIKCNITLPRGFESANIHKHLVAHFSGNRHNTAKDASLFSKSSSQSQPQRLQNNPKSSAISSETSTASHRLKVPDKDNSSVPRSLIDINNPYCYNPVFEAFRKVPTHLQGDMKYIKDGASPNYLICILCGNTIIPLIYLKEHLIEENHLKEKIIFEERVSEMKTQLKT